MTTGVRVWDLPTRLFHWLLVALFVFSWWSAENHAMDWHYLSGLTLLGLLVFRICWGLFGGSTARFSGFVRSPAAVIAYLKGKGGTAIGHNPLGGYSTILMLLLLALQVIGGLFATDIDGLESGPLSFLVSFEQGRFAAELHEATFNLLLAVVALHILAILFYLVVRRRNLVRPMVTGRDAAADPAAAPLRPASAAAFLAACAIAAAVAWAAGKGFWL